MPKMDAMDIIIKRIDAEADDDLTCLALSIVNSKDELLENCRFLQLICESLARKIIPSFPSSEQ